MRADVVTVHQVKRKPGRIVAEGRPVKFEQRTEKGPVKGQARKVEQVSLGSVGGLLTLTALWLLVAGDNAYPGDSGMRILWQLIQGGAAGLVLLVGCIMLFKKRGGVVLIHLGVGLMMFGQFWVARHDVEEQMTIKEGETVWSAERERDAAEAVSLGPESEVH